MLITDLCTTEGYAQAGAARGRCLASIRFVATTGFGTRASWLVAAPKPMNQVDIHTRRPLDRSP